MIPRLRLSIAFGCCIAILGCSYYGEYEKAMKAKERAEQVAADAQRDAKEARDQLTAEQEALARIYSED